VQKYFLLKYMKLYRYTQFVLRTLAVCLSVWLTLAQASAIYRWTDAQGNTHFSDLPPPAAGATAVTRRVEDASTRQDLRPGEQATLRAIEQRQQTRQRQLTQDRRQQRQARQRHERDCRERREQLRRGRRHADGKTLAKYLRVHCW